MTYTNVIMSIYRRTWSIEVKFFRIFETYE